MQKTSISLAAITVFGEATTFPKGSFGRGKTAAFAEGTTSPKGSPKEHYVPSDVATTQPALQLFLILKTLLSLRAEVYST